LKDLGYNGFVSVEVFNFDEGAVTIATKSLAYLKSAFANAAPLRDKAVGTEN